MGRDLFVIPGHPFDSRASGSNILIRDGARLVRSSKDILDEITHLIPETPIQSREVIEDIKTPDVENPQDVHSDAAPSHILSALDHTPISDEDLIQSTAHPADQVLKAIQKAELTGELERHADGRISRVA